MKLIFLTLLTLLKTVFTEEGCGCVEYTPQNIELLIQHQQPERLPAVPHLQGAQQLQLEQQQLQQLQLIEQQQIKQVLNFTDAIFDTDLDEETALELSSLLSTIDDYIRIFSRVLPGADCSVYCAGENFNWHSSVEGYCACGWEDAIISCEEEIGPTIDVYCIEYIEGLNSTEWVEPVVVDVQVPQLPPDLAPLLVHHQEEQSHHQQQQQQEQDVPNDNKSSILVENAPSDDHKLDGHTGSGDNEAGTSWFKAAHSDGENGSYDGAASGDIVTYIGAASGDVGEAHGGIDAVQADHNDPHGGEEGGPIVKPKKDYKTLGLILGLTGVVCLMVLLVSVYVQAKRKRAAREKSLKEAVYTNAVAVSTAVDVFIAREKTPKTAVYNDPVAVTATADVYSIPSAVTATAEVYRNPVTVNTRL